MIRTSLRHIHYIESEQAQWGGMALRRWPEQLYPAQPGYRRGLARATGQHHAVPFADAH